MMKILIILMLLSNHAFAVLKIRDNAVQPFTSNDMRLAEFVEFYANTYQVTLTAGSKIKLQKYKVNLVINSALSKAEMTDLLDTVLEHNGLTRISDGVGYSIINSRDIRYLPVATYNSSDNPGGKKFVLVYHKMKYPLGRKVSRSLRPFISRYGRVVNFSDGKSLIIADYGENIKRLIKVVDSVDNKESYKVYLAKKESKKIKDPKTEKLRKEILDLKMENNILIEQVVKNKKSKGRK